MSGQWAVREVDWEEVSVVIEQTADRIARELAPLSRDQRIVLDALLYALAYDAAGMRGEPE